MNKAIHKKKKQFNRAVAVMIAIAVLLIATIGTTVAFLITGTDPIINIFTPSKVTTEVVKTDSGYAIKNADDTQAYIRAAVVVNWKNSEGHVYATAPVAGTDYNITFNDDNWIEKDYGNGEILYYYKSPVDPNNQTSDLNIEFILADNANVPDGYTLSIEVLGSGIQSTPYGVVAWKWDVKVDNSGIISVEVN